MSKRYLLKFNIGLSFKATNKASYQNKDMQKQFKSKGKTIKAFPSKWKQGYYKFTILQPLI